MHEKFPNCSAYYFTKIDRNCNPAFMINRCNILYEFEYE
jgi:hypothetical protein